MDTALREQLREHRRDYMLRELIGGLAYLGGFASLMAIMQWLELSERKHRARDGK